MVPQVASFQVYAAPMDMRKGIDTLAAVVQGELGRNPWSGEAFVFVGKRGDRLKVLLGQPQGVWLCQYRLERGRFRIPHAQRRDGRVCTVELSLSEWHALLEGLVVQRSRRLPRFNSSG